MTYLSPELADVRHIETHSVRADALSKRFGERTVLDELSFEIAGGEIIAILGASGCGKSTLLRLLAGLEQPSSGQLLIGETAVQAADPRCAFAFQEPRLLPWRSVADNIAYGLPHGLARAERRARVATLVDLVGLAAASTLRPREISGGMAQRVSLARALARGPEVLLLDEPFGALDALTRLRMQDLLLDIHAAQPTTVVLVTHDVDEALQLADRIVILATPAPAAPAVIARTITVPGERPRDRAAHDLADLRADILEGFGIDRHAHQ